MALVADLLQHVEAVDAGELEVEQQQVEVGARGQGREKVLARLKVGELVAHVDLHVGQVERVAVDDALYAQAQRLFVVDHDDFEGLALAHDRPFALPRLRAKSTTRAAAA